MRKVNSVTIASSGGEGSVTVTETNSAAIKTAVQLIDDAIYTDGAGTPTKGVLILGTDGTNPQAVKVNSDGEILVNLETADIQIGAVEIKNSTDDTRATVGANGLYTDVRASVLPSGAATESTLSSVKTAVEAIDNAVDGNYLNVNNNIAGTDIVGGAGAVAAGVQRMTLASDDPAVTALKIVQGQDFLMITDAVAHAGLDCTMISVMADAVFSDITVGGSNVVAGKGLTAISVVAGTLLPFGKEHATSITLTSGTVIAYIN